MPAARSPAPGGAQFSPQFPEFDSLSVKYSIVHGPDWTVTAVRGRLPARSPAGAKPHGGLGGLFFPARRASKRASRRLRASQATASAVLCGTFPSTRRCAAPTRLAGRRCRCRGYRHPPQPPQPCSQPRRRRWNQVVISVYGLDSLGRDVVRGYGTVPLPVSPGMHTRRVAVFVPRSSSKLQQAFAWLLGQRPEFVDSKFVAQGVGREGAAIPSPGGGHDDTLLFG